MYDLINEFSLSIKIKILLQDTISAKNFGRKKIRMENISDGKISDEKNFGRKKIRIKILSEMFSFNVMHISLCKFKMHTNGKIRTLQCSAPSTFGELPIRSRF